MAKSLSTTDPSAGIYSTIEVVVFNGNRTLNVLREKRTFPPYMVQLNLSLEALQATILHYGEVLALDVKSELPAWLENTELVISVGKKVIVVPSHSKAKVKEC